MPRILALIARLNLGGPPQHVVRVLKDLQSDGWEVLLAAGKPAPEEGDMGALAERSGIPRVEVPGLGREVSPLKDLRALLSLFGLIRRWRPDVMSTHTAKAGALGRGAALLAALLPPWRRPALVHNFHGHVLQGYFPRWVSALYLRIERILARRSDAVAVVSPAVGREIVWDFAVAPPERVRLLRGRHELGRFVGPKKPLRKSDLGFETSDFLLGAVGRLVPIKGIDLLLDAFREAASKRTDLRLVLVGDGQSRPLLEDRVRLLGLGRRVRFTGWYEAIERVYPALDLVVLSSLNEGSPRSLIEAMAAGRAIVATAVGGVPDLLGGSPPPSGGTRGFSVGPRGILVRPGDRHALAAALLWAASHPQICRRTSEIAKAWVVRTFSPDAGRRAVRTFYRGLLGSGLPDAPPGPTMTDQAG